jgi:hypothetical protein
VEFVVEKCAIVLKSEDLIGGFGIDFPGESAFFHFAVFHKPNELAIIFVNFQLTLAVKGVALELANIRYVRRHILTPAIKRVIQKVSNIIPILSKPLEPFTTGLSVSKSRFNNGAILVFDHSISIGSSLGIKLANVNTILEWLDISLIDIDVDFG